MTFLKELNIALARKDMSYIENSLTEDISVRIIGNSGTRIIEGRPQVLDIARKLHTEHIAELGLDTILSHGKSGAVNAWILWKGEEVFHYASFYNFKGARGKKVKEISLYIILSPSS